MHPQIKGIGVECVQISGTRNLSLQLKCDNGDVDIITHLNSVYVPLSPYNLIPPHIIIKKCAYRDTSSMISLTTTKYMSSSTASLPATANLVALLQCLWEITVYFNSTLIMVTRNSYPEHRSTAENSKTSRVLLT